jgi:hypothetical protein
MTFFHAGRCSMKKSNSSVKKSNFSVKKSWLDEENIWFDLMIKNHFFVIWLDLKSCKYRKDNYVLYFIFILMLCMNVSGICHSYDANTNTPNTNQSFYVLKWSACYVLCYDFSDKTGKLHILKAKSTAYLPTRTYESAQSIQPVSSL